MVLTEYIKPNGVKILLNDEEATLKYAKDNGFKPYDATPEGIAEAEKILEEREQRAEDTLAKAAENKPKRGRPAKEHDVSGQE